MNVTVDCDLRTSNEQVMAPDRKWPGVEVLDCHVYAEDSSGNFVNDSHKLYRFYITFLKLIVIWVRFTKM